MLRMRGRAASSKVQCAPDVHVPAGGSMAEVAPADSWMESLMGATLPTCEAILQVAADVLNADAAMLTLWSESEATGSVLARLGAPDLLPADALALLGSQRISDGQPRMFHRDMVGDGPQCLTWTVIPLTLRHGTARAVILVGRRGGLPEGLEGGSLRALARVCSVAFEDGVGRRAAALLDGLPEAVVVTDATGRIRQLNRRAERLFGYARAELAGQPADLLMPGDAAAGIVIGRRHDGYVFTADVSLALVDTDGELEMAHVVRDLAHEEDRLGKEEQFFLEASHELRTPAATIKASAEVLNDVLGQGLPVDLRRLLLNIEREADRLGTLIDHLLDLNSIRRARVRLHPIRCDLREVAVRAADSIEPLARQREQTVLRAMPTTPVWSVVDADLLGRAILNLVSNAHKYGRHGGRLEVRLETCPSEAVFVISDDGPGIPEADRERVFQRFYRSPTADGRRVQGNGLGLPVSRAAVELLGGRVWAEAGPAVGSAFKVALPLGLGSATSDRPV